MTETAEKRGGVQAERAKRLAEALRENLRRRKAPPKTSAGEPDKATEKPETGLP